MAHGFKYIARIRGKNGKWRYIYKEDKPSGNGPENSRDWKDDVKNAYDAWGRWSTQNRETAGRYGKQAWDWAKENVPKAYDAWSRWSTQNRETAARGIKDAYKTAKRAWVRMTKHKTNERFSNYRINNDGSISKKGNKKLKSKSSGSSPKARVKKRKTVSRDYSVKTTSGGRPSRKRSPSAGQAEVRPRKKRQTLEGPTR